MIKDLKDRYNSIINHIFNITYVEDFARMYGDCNLINLDKNIFLIQFSNNQLSIDY